MKGKNFITLIVMLFALCCLASCGSKTHQISVEELKNGAIIPSVLEASSGEEVTLTVKPDPGYELKKDSLKANGNVITNNSFIMPDEDVKISAVFEMVTSEIKIENTNLEISAISSAKSAKAHISTSFKDDGLNILVVVEDTKLISANDIEYSDGVVLMFSDRTKHEGFLDNVTTKLELLVSGSHKLYIYDGTNFVSSDLNYEAVCSYFAAGGSVGGYVFDVTLPYETLHTTKNDAKESITMCPVIYNKNVSSTNVKSIYKSAKDYFCNPDNQNTYLYVVADNTYETNYYAHGSFQLGFLDYEVNNNWDLTEDLYPEDSNYDNRVAILSGTDEKDNILVMHRYNDSKIYLEASFLLTDVYGDETLGKFGYRFLDEDGNGFAFFIDAHGSSLSVMNSSRDAGYALINETLHDWSTHVVYPVSYVPGKLEKVKLAVYRDNGIFKFYVNDMHIGTLTNPNDLSDELIYPEIFSFNLGIEVSEYYSTNNEAEIKQLLPKDKANGYIFKNESETLPNGIYWDLSKDTETSSGPVTLDTHDGVDNHLIFNMSSKEFMYARATIEVVEYLNKGDAWLKFGLTFFDGDLPFNSTQIMFYADAFTGDNRYASSLYDIIGDDLGKAVRTNGSWGNTWSTYSSGVNKFNLGTMKITMELVYYNNQILFYADGALIATENYTPKNNNLYMGIKNFGFGLEVTNYYCTTDMHDKNINISIPAKGKALYYFLGSSVTYGSATNGVSFVDLIPQQLQVNVVKEAVSGTTLVDTGSDSYVQRLRRMNTNSKVDHLIVQLSTNDASLNKTLGSVSAAGTTSFDTSTIIGAIEDIIYYAKNTLGCDVTFYTNPNYSNSKYQEMVEALYSVQEKWGIGIIDFYNISDMNAQALSSKGYMADSIHPNDKGYKWMTEVFVSYLRADYSSKHPGDSI